MSSRTLEVRLRPAVETDDRKILEWRNEPGTRAASFNSAAITLDEHRAWLARKKDDATLRLYIVSDADGRDIGYVRFDVRADAAEISVSLDAACRHRGYGRAAIREGARLMLGEPRVTRVVALVKPDNAESLAAFKAAGFAERGREVRCGFDARVLEYREKGAGA